MIACLFALADGISVNYSAMTTMTSHTETCLCGSGLNYSDCCGPYHAGEKLPATAEQLMRSRFTAYALRNVDYLLASWDTSKRPASIDFSKETAAWQTLQIIDCKKGGAKDSKGIVEFKAYYSQDGESYFMHEISRFVKTNQRWLYLDGVIKAAGKVASTANAGRNALCACGSGKKFKHCCGR
ncbi:YchJ family protein [Methylomonas rapida]|nr:YchJ family protein [Methylomonas rapida]